MRLRILALCIILYLSNSDGSSASAESPKNRPVWNHGKITLPSLNNLPSIPNLLDKCMPNDDNHNYPRINLPALKFPSFPNILSAVTKETPKFLSVCGTRRKQVSAAISNHEVRNVSVAVKKRRRENNTGSYYGITDRVFFPDKDNDEIRDGSKTRAGKQRDTASALADVMGETLLELREMREDISALREEMQAMKKKLDKRNGDRQNGYDPYDDYEFEGDAEDSDERYGEEVEGLPSHQRPQQSSGSYVWRMKRQRKYDATAKDIEKWGERLLFAERGEENGWRKVHCNKMVRNKFNKDGSIECYIKYMKDSRGKDAKKDDGDQTYPCIKCYATINAPLEQVCAYLSDERRVPEYNDLVNDHRDLEEISLQSKICWAKCPQILFIKSRDFVTFCHYRWKNDGTQVVVNQACEHRDAPGNDDDSDGKICRAMALRGANFISRDPKDPNKTRFALLAHADPGGGIPTWAMKTAVNAVAPIEPFKLFARIEKNVIASGKSYENRTKMVKSMPGRSTSPAGLSQMGYACFWPNGGALKDGNDRSNYEAAHIAERKGISSEDEDAKVPLNGDWD